MNIKCQKQSVVVSCCDDAASSYNWRNGSHIGMNVNGTVGNVWFFRFACSSAFSPIEQQVGSPEGVQCLTPEIYRGITEIEL